MRYADGTEAEINDEAIEAVSAAVRAAVRGEEHAASMTTTTSSPGCSVNGTCSTVVVPKSAGRPPGS
jgi:hypothetical protein